MMDTKEIIDRIRTEIRRTKRPVTYGFIWDIIHPDKPWDGRYCQTIVMDVLGDISKYCNDKEWPVVSAAVVQKNTYTATPTAMSNLFNYNKNEIGRCDTEGHTAETYFYAQQKAVIEWA